MPKPSGEPKGAPRPSRYAQAPSTLEALVSDLDRLGFDPIVTDAADDPDAAVVAFAHCPFAELAEAHPELVCGLHRGLVAGFVAADGRRRGRRVLHAHQPHAVSCRPIASR